MSCDTSLCTRFASEWFANPRWWFNCSPSDDAYLSATFGSLLEMKEHLPMSIGRVLVLDQLPYHIHRHEHKNTIVDEFHNPHNDEAVIVSRSLREQVELSAQEMTFVLLPLRHSRRPELVLEAIRAAWSKLLLCEDGKSADHLVWTRFLTATYKQASKCDWSTYLDIYENKQAGLQVLQPFDKKSFEDILVIHEPVDDQDNSSETIDTCFAVWFDQHSKVLSEDASCFIISLSGGVDSNISSFILANLLLRKEHKLSHLPLVAVHINYKNKPLCDRDEEMVVAWCKHIGIPCYVRRISEIQRKPCMEHGLRSIYESCTENVRFDAYRNVANIVAPEATLQGRKPIVFFGHNKCDSMENIITNVIRKQHMDNLRGMVPLLPVHDVFCARPMLTVPKDDIRIYARRHQIPHLQDSTPPWSQRGKIRTIIRKAFDEYDPNLTPAMFHLADRMAEASLVLKSLVSMALRYAQLLAEPPSPFVAAWTLKLSTNDLLAPFAPTFWHELLLQLTQLRCNQGSLTHNVDRSHMFLQQSEQTKVNLQFHSRIQVEIGQPLSGEHIVYIKLLAANL